MADALTNQHTPALKVGGRRLSVSTKHKTTPHLEPASNENKDNDDPVVPDYPRPAPPTGDAPPQQNYQHNEEEAPLKKERNDNKVKEMPHWKAESTRPTREHHGGSKNHGTSGMRISQPAGKVLGA